MILDSLKSATNYLQLSTRIRQAFDFIANHDLKNMAPGKYMLDGENLFLTIAELSGKSHDQAFAEAHKKYIDIQIVLQGQETMGWLSIDHCKHEMEPYLAENDIVFFADKPTTFLTLNEDEFVVFFPEDGHAPGIGKGPIKKAIVKVLVETTKPTK